MAVTFQKSELIKAIKDSGGIMSTIANRLNCDWHTADKKIREADLLDLLNDEKETLLDLAESKLIQNIQEQDNTAIIFYLKTQGKKRGYIERSEVQNDVSLTVTELTPEQRDKRIAELRKKLDDA